MTKKQLSLCFLGCGHICAKHAASLSKLFPEITLSFASRDGAKAERYRSKYKGAKAFDSYEAALEDKAMAVYFITTPPHLHFELAKVALMSSRHVILEKPPVFTSKDLQQLGAWADQQKVQLLVAENYFYRPLRAKIASILNSDIIGQPLYIHLNASKYQKSKEDWREETAISKYGALFEGGIHWVNFINNIGLTYKQTNGFNLSNQPMDRSFQINALSHQGPSANLYYSWETNTIFQGLRISRIYGTKGSVTFESNGLFVFVRGRRWAFSFPNFAHITGFKLMYRDFIHAILEGTPAQFTWKDAVRDLEMIESAYQSAGIL